MLKKMLYRIGLLSLGALMVFALAGCAEEGTDNTALEGNNQNTTETSTSQTSGESVQIGGIFALTGDGASIGEPMQKVAQIALDKINATGGIDGKKFEIKWEDGKCNGNDGAMAANKLVNIDKVQVILGGLCSSETLAAAPIVETAKVALFSPSSTSPNITTAGDYVFRNAPSDASQGKILAEQAMKKGYKKVAVITEQNDYTNALQKVFETRFKELGGTTDIQSFQLTDSDFRTLLLKLKSGKPDALFINTQTPVKADLVFKQLEEQKWTVPFIGNEVIAGYQDLITKYSEVVEGMILAEFRYDKENADFKALAEEYKKQTNTEMPYGSYAVTTYDAVYILKEAIEKVGNDGTKVKDYLYSIKDRQGMAGLLTIDPNGDPLRGYSPEIVKEGKVVAMEE